MIRSRNMEAGLKLPRAYTAHVFKLLKHFESVLAVNEYDIVVDFVSKIENGATANIAINLRYLFATIKLTNTTLDLWNEGRWRDLADALLHELCHLYTEPMWSLAEPHTAPVAEKSLTDVNEQATQRICTAILRLTPSSLYIPEKHTFKGKDARKI